MEKEIAKASLTEYLSVVGSDGGGNMLLPESDPTGSGGEGKLDPERIKANRENWKVRS